MLKGGRRGEQAQMLLCVRNMRTCPSFQLGAGGQKGAVSVELRGKKLNGEGETETVCTDNSLRNSVCMHVRGGGDMCVRVCICVYVHVYMHVCAYIFMRVHACVSVHVCVFMCVHDECIHLCVHACVYVCVYVCAYMCVYTCVHVHPHTRAGGNALGQ